MGTTPAAAAAASPTTCPTCSTPVAAAELAIVLLLRPLTARAAEKGRRGAQELGAAHWLAAERAGAAAAAARRGRPAAASQWWHWSTAPLPSSDHAPQQAGRLTSRGGEQQEVHSGGSRGGERHRPAGLPSVLGCTAQANWAPQIDVQRAWAGHLGS